MLEEQILCFCLLFGVLLMIALKNLLFWFPERLWHPCCIIEFFFYATFLCLFCYVLGDVLSCLIVLPSFVANKIPFFFHQTK